MKRVFSFGNGVAEGAGLGKETLGGKGAGLAEMTALGVPVPPGFTIETSVCADISRGASLDGIRAEVESALHKLEHDADKRFGDPRNPLLVSVRSGARSSMPGMMDTILNLGLTTRTVPGLSAMSGDRFALAHRRSLLFWFGLKASSVSRNRAVDRTRVAQRGTCCVRLNAGNSIGNGIFRRGCRHAQRQNVNVAFTRMISLSLRSAG